MQCTIGDCTLKRVSKVACTDHSKMGYRCCIICGGTFKIEGKGRVYTCSSPCRAIRIECIIDGCESPKASKGLCQMHAARKRKWGDPHRFGPIVSCNHCERDFEATLPWQKSCSEKCRLGFKAEYREQNRERRSKYNAEWREKNPVKNRLKWQRRRALLRTVTYQVSDRDIRRLLERYRHECAHCSVDIRGGYHLDHVMPINKGGTHSIGNLVPACARCNESKSDWLLYEWLLKQRVGRPLRRKKAS